jgi:diguanylate cyclase (GGDEF)-like protein
LRFHGQCADYRNVDEAELRYRAETIGASMLPTHALCVFGWIYVALTWSEPHRAFLAALFAVGVASQLVLARLPLDRVVRTRWREPFFVAWSVGDIALIAVAVAADGGVTSPLTLVYLFPLLFASLSYPLRSLLVVYAAALTSYAAVALAIDTDAPRILMGLAALGLAPFLGFLQAREHDRQRRRLAHSARTDALTGLLNHSAFLARLDAELSENRTLALIALDVDRFKQVNDRFGHGAGDDALRGVADALQSVVRPGDLCARMGGDEFMLALPGTGPAVAQRVAERVQLALSAAPVTVSLGVAVSPDHATERGALMRCADAAMYRSKQRGRDRAGVFEPLA